MKTWHDCHIRKRELHNGQKVLLFNLRLCLFSGKLRTQWSVSFVVKEIFLHGAVDITSPDEKNVFKLNGQRLKTYFEDEDHAKISMDLT